MHTWEARSPRGNVRASSGAVLKLLRGRFCATTVFLAKGWGPELSIVFGETREGSGAHHRRCGSQLRGRRFRFCVE